MFALTVCHLKAGTSKKPGKIRQCQVPWYEIYPETKASELEVSYSKTGRLQVKMFDQGKKTYPLYSKKKKGTNNKG